MRRRLRLPAAVALVLAGLVSATAADDGSTATGVVVHNGAVFTVLEERSDGWVVATPCRTEIFLDEGVRFYTADVVLDPGHGGPETGSVGANGLVERDVNLWVALLTRAELEALGYSVVLTREVDLHMGIVQRANVANALSPSGFVSIHHNGGAVRHSHEPGTETFHQYGDDESRRLAGLLFEEVQAALATWDVRWVDTVHKGTSARIRSDNTDVYGVLRLTPDLPSAIVEAAYLSNAPEAELLADPEVLIAEAAAIARAVDRFLTSGDPGSGFKRAFVDAATTGTGTGWNCDDSGYGHSVSVASGYTEQEYADLVAMAARVGRSPESLQRFGVYALDFFHALGGRVSLDPFPPEVIPVVSGSSVPVDVTLPWTPADQVLLTRVADAYGLSPAEAQKVGAVLMVFLIGISG
ncbi:MAG: N-acetylmuramoyl-L-alanine amidase [Acidimicrobiales bacterium]|nr:N-acetylmuramoyl-L-alanine amidase [Acidimicrobiales bacterium]